MKELKELLRKNKVNISDYDLGFVYSLKIKTSNRLVTFYAKPESIEKLKILIPFYIAKENECSVCYENQTLSKLLQKVCFFKDIKTNDDILKGYLDGYKFNNLKSMKIGSSRFWYMHGKKYILRCYDINNSLITEFGKYHILYILDTCSWKDVDNFNKLFNIKEKEKYKALIGILIGDGHLKEYNYIQITHTDPQKDYIQFMYSLFTYWGIKSTIGNTSNTKKQRTDGSVIYNHYLYVTLSNKDYFKNRVSLTNKQVNSYLASRLTPLSLLFWFLDDGCYTKCGINLFTNGFDMLSQNMLTKYLTEIYNITPKIYTNKQGYNFLHLNVKDSKKYLNIINVYMPYLPTCFKHKFPYFNNSSCMI